MVNISQNANDTRFFRGCPWTEWNLERQAIEYVEVAWSVRIWLWLQETTWVRMQKNPLAGAIMRNLLVWLRLSGLIILPKG
jgi:hypothetical protein